MLEYFRKKKPIIIDKNLCCWRPQARRSSPRLSNNIAFGRHVDHDRGVDAYRVAPSEVCDRRCVPESKIRRNSIFWITIETRTRSSKIMSHCAHIYFDGFVTAEKAFDTIFIALVLRFLKFFSERRPLLISVSETRNSLKSLHFTITRKIHKVAIVARAEKEWHNDVERLYSHGYRPPSLYGLDTAIKIT